jgi:hypothetical protein
MSPEIVVRAVQSYFAAIKTMNADTWVANFAEDAEAYDPADASPEALKRSH